MLVVKLAVVLAGMMPCHDYGCDQYQWDTLAMADPVAECLMAYGYIGDPTDGRDDILLAPSEMISWCGKHHDAYGSVSA